MSNSRYLAASDAKTPMDREIGHQPTTPSSRRPSSRKFTCAAPINVNADCVNVALDRFSLKVKSQSFNQVSTVWREIFIQIGWQCADVCDFWLNEILKARTVAWGWKKEADLVLSPMKTKRKRRLILTKRSLGAAD